MESIENWMEGARLSLAIIGITGFIVYILFLAEQQRTIRAVDISNRYISPGQVWLQLIPVFGLIWQFQVTKKIADSLQQELRSRNNTSQLGVWEEGITDEVNIHPTYTTGLWYCILVTVSCIPFLGFLTFIFAFIMWIAYWSQLIKYRKILSF